MSDIVRTWAFISEMAIRRQTEMLSSYLAFKRITLVALFKKDCEVWKLKKEGSLELLSHWERGGGLDQFNRREGDEKLL